jgi:hypothetical protein
MEHYRQLSEMSFAEILVQCEDAIAKYPDPEKVSYREALWLNYWIGYRIDYIVIGMETGTEDQIERCKKVISYYYE